MVPDDILERMKSVTTEDAWTVLKKHGWEHNFAAGWTVLFPDRVLVGRAVTCRWVPMRPELHEALLRLGEAEGRVGFLNSWVIDEMVDGDVLVADLFGKVNLVGDNLTTAIKANGGRGMVIDGGIRDLQRILKIPDFCHLREAHPPGGDTGCHHAGHQRRHPHRGGDLHSRRRRPRHRDRGALHPPAPGGGGRAFFREERRLRSAAAGVPGAGPCLSGGGGGGCGAGKFGRGLVRRGGDCTASQKLPPVTARGSGISTLPTGCR